MLQRNITSDVIVHNRNGNRCFYVRDRTITSDVIVRTRCKTRLFFGASAGITSDVIVLTRKNNCSFVLLQRTIQDAGISTHPHSPTTSFTKRTPTHPHTPPRQATCAGFRLLCKEHPDSMVALHLPWQQLEEWRTAMQANNFHAVPTPITIGSTQTPAYAPTFVHTPLGASQTFFLWRTMEASRPYNNAAALASLWPKGHFRKSWSSFQVISPTDYRKSPAEVLKRINGQYLPVEQCDEVSSADTSFFHSEVDPAAVVPAFLNGAVQKAAKSRMQHWRKEQISQGVLRRILGVIGRVVLEQVQSGLCMCVRVYVSVSVYVYV